MVGKKAKVKNEKKVVAIPIEWYMPEGNMTPTAFNMTIQVMEDIFKVSFFEIKPPIQVDESAPPPDKIRADCIASVFIAPHRIPKFIELLQNQYDNYMSERPAK